VLLTIHHLAAGERTLAFNLCKPAETCERPGRHR
jgi:hypothetical protein